MPPATRNTALSVRDAESLFRSKPISEIRSLESATKREIESKKEELRLLVRNRYRGLIESADSILLIKSSSQSISSNLSAIDSSLRSLSSFPVETLNPNPNSVQSRNYAIATRVKYLVDTPESIWGCLDGSLFLEASGRYLRAKVVRGTVGGDSILNSPLLRHHWQIVKGFKGQISQRSRERLMDQGLGVEAYADALAAVAIVDQLDPKQALALFLELRRSWILQRLGNLSSAPSVSSVFCDVVRIIQVSLAQVGELFLQVSNDLPLFYKTVLGSPPGTQLFGGVSNPDEEVRLWKLHRERLESVMVMLEPGFIAQTCLSWLKKCGEKIVGKSCGRFLINAVGSGVELSSVERMIRELLDGRESLEGSLEWLRSVFGHEIQSSPWNQIGQLVLKDSKDLWDDIFEDAFVQRMKEVVDLGFEELSKAVNVRDSIRAIVAGPDEQNDFQAYMKRPSTGGGVWFSESNYRKISPVSGFKTMKDENDFSSCLDLYFGPEVSQIRDAMDSRFQIILNDLLCFLESPKSSLRLKELAPYLQDKCYTSISTVLEELEDELRHLSTDLGNRNEKYGSEQPATIVERALLIGRLLFALQNHSSHIPLILGSPRMWLKTEMRTLLFDRTQSLLKQSMVGFEFDPPMPDSPRRRVLDKPRRETSATAALFAVENRVNPKLDELSKMFRDLGIKAHRLWIKWVSDELATILFKDLEKDDALSATTLTRVVAVSKIPLNTVKKSPETVATSEKISNMESETRGVKPFVHVRQALPSGSCGSFSQGWEETVVKQEQFNEGPLEIKIALPSIPSLYITSFLFQACQEIHRIGGHVLDKVVLQNFVWNLLDKILELTHRHKLHDVPKKLRKSQGHSDAFFAQHSLLALLKPATKEALYVKVTHGSRGHLVEAFYDKVLGIYGDFISSLEDRVPRVSEKGVLQVLLDLRFTVDILSGGKDSSFSRTDLSLKETTKSLSSKPSQRRKQDRIHLSCAAHEELVMGLMRSLSQRLDPIDWATYEPYLWENEKQSYQRYAVLYGFLVQLNRMYMGTVQKLPSNTESNVLRCSIVPRFKYLPISAPVLSSRGPPPTTFSSASSKLSSRSFWKAYSVKELSPELKFDDTTSFPAAAPLFKSFMTQVGRFKGKSAAPMSTFGDMLPVQASGFLSSFMSGAGKSDP